MLARMEQEQSWWGEDGHAYGQMSCSHLVGCKGCERDGGKHGELPPCWQVVWMGRIRVVELTGPHDGDVRTSSSRLRCDGGVGAVERVKAKD